jgi:hypothetical protein
MRQFSALSAAALCAAFLVTSCGGSKESSVRTYPMGEKVTIGHMVYSVFETEWRAKLGEDPDTRIPKQRFFLVRMSIVNGTGEELLAPNITLEDDRGNSYSELGDGTGVPQWMGFLRKIKPAEAAQGNAVFDVPPAHYKMRVLDEIGERAALIDIPFSLVAESPDIPVPPPPAAEKKTESPVVPASPTPAAPKKVPPTAAPKK